MLLLERRLQLFQGIAIFHGILLGVGKRAESRLVKRKTGRGVFGKERFQPLESRHVPVLSGRVDVCFDVRVRCHSLTLLLPVAVTASFPSLCSIARSSFS